MIVKTGLQDAAKNVHIYGTISAASSPSARPPLHRRRASRITLPCPLSLPLRLSSSAPSPSHPRPDLLLYVPLSPPFRGAHVGSYFLSFVVARLRVYPPFPSLLSTVLFVIPTRSPHFVRGRGGGPTTVGRAQRGAIAPTAAGTTLMLH